jgi:DUF971 family protein
MSSTEVKPTDIALHTKSRQLELHYEGEQPYLLSCEYLRVYSPSAEVKGHGHGQEVLQTGKMNVAITAIKPVGNYALQLIFDDGHDSGLYSWSYFRDLCINQDSHWQDYLDRLTAAGATRDPDVQVVKIGL